MRIRINKIVILALIISVVLCACSSKEEVQERQSQGAEASWPIFRGDSRLSGIARDKIPDKLDLLWSFPTGSEIYSSPVIGFGHVYVGSTDGKVYSLGLVDGSKSWEFDTGDEIEASPLILDERIYIGSLAGDFFALDAHTGSLVWQSKTDNSIYGSANWAEAQSDQRKSIFVGCYDNKLYCFDSESGEHKWTYETDNYINGAPATDGEIVVFGGCDEILHIVSVIDGTKQGEVWAGSYIPGSAAIVENRAYLGHYNNQLICIDIPERKILWIYEDKENGAPFFSSPAVSKDRVVIGSRDGFLHCVDRATGEKMWTFRTRGDLDSSPVISRNKALVGSTDGRLYILNLENGREIWSYELGAAIVASPAVAGGYVIVGAEDGRVYTFGEGS